MKQLTLKARSLLFTLLVSASVIMSACTPPKPPEVTIWADCDKSNDIVDAIQCQLHNANK